MTNKFSNTNLNNSIKEKNFIFNKWIDFEFDINNNLISKELISKALNSLLIKFTTISNYKDILIMIQFKIKIINNNEYKSISRLQIVKLSEFDDLLDVFNEYWDLKSEDYFIINNANIIFTYKLIDSSKLEDKFNKSKLYRFNETPKNKLSRFKFNGYRLPSNMDYEKWGDIITTNNNTIKIKKAYSNKAFYDVIIKDSYLDVTLMIKNKIIIKFKDYLNNKADLYTFTRYFNNQEYIYINGKLVLIKLVRETKFLSKIKPETFINNKFITMDLETKLINNIMVPYCVSIYDGVKPKSFYLSDYLNSNNMLIESLKYIIKPKYNHYKIFLHNFSNFDAIFLLRIITELNYNIYPIIRDGRIIDLKLKDNLNKFTIYFRDSYLLLPSSLKNLAINFNVDLKGIFPYRFINNISLNYKGEVPDYKYFDNINLNEYNEYKSQFKNNIWDLKNETIKYCEQDVITLYQIIDKFNLNLFVNFRIDILKYPTLSSIAFAIYRTKFLNNYKIPLINGSMFYDIKQGYTGGSVDVYKPYGNNIHCYDVNSLYPFVMKEKPMPVGKPVYFEGDILDFEDYPFGIFEAEIEAPKNIEIPILQIRTKTNNNNIRTISPLGKWIGVYTSEELYNSTKYNYKFKVIRGYLFEKGYIFKDYVDYLFSIKINSKKDSANYIITKLLLNSLYGRLGMNPEMEKHMIINNEDSLSYHDNYKLNNVIDLKNGKELISFFDDRYSNDIDNTLNISIPISTMVTAYGRIHMTKFKNNNFKLYYTDTDSVFIENSLPDHMVGDDLGKMKLERIFDKAIFLSPKVYGGKYKLPNGNLSEYIKVKGLKNSITFAELKTLIYKNTKLEINQDKWYKNISNGNISIKNEIYTLMLTDNKRKIVYENNKFVSTEPYFYIDNKLI